MSKFDKDLEVGDFITAYHKGYWKVTAIERRYRDRDWRDQKIGDEYASLISYELAADTHLRRPVKTARKECCDATYCTKIDDQYFEFELYEFKSKIETLKKLRDELLENK